MSSTDVDLHVEYRIANAPMLEFPYPHLYVRDIFPPDYYARLRANLPSEPQLRTLTALGRVTEGYPETRLVLPLAPEHTGRLEPGQRAFWEELAGWMRGRVFGAVIAGAWIAMPLGMLLGGMLTDRLGTFIMMISLAVTFLATTLSMAFIPAMKEMDRKS